MLARFLVRQPPADAIRFGLFRLRPSSNVSTVNTASASD
jgi:hypothetical protein